MAQYRTPRYRQRTVNRPATTYKCAFVPNRTEERKFNERDAARITCYVLRSGGTQAEIDAHLKQLCPQEAERPRPIDAAAVAAAISALTQSNATLLDSYNAFLIINGLLAALAAILLVARFLGPLRVIAVPSRAAVTAAQTQVGVLMRVNITSRAANDEAIALLRAAA